MEKICWQITVAAFMQPLQYDLRDPAAKDNSITKETARSNLDAAITMRSAETELPNTLELRATASEIVAPKPNESRRQSEKKTILKHFLKGFLEGKSLTPKWRKSADKSLWQPSCSHSNTIYEIQLQKTIVLRTQPKQEATLQSHLHCGKDPTVANHNGIPSTTHPAAPLAIPFTLRERSYSCKSQWNSVDHTCTKNSWNPIYNAEPIRDRSEDDPTISRPHTRPSRTRRTAEVDHRGSGMHFVWKNIGFRASAISQKRISCETSFKTPSATPPPAPLAMPFTLREGSYSCKSQWNSIDNSSSSTTCNPIYIAGTILQLQITMEFCRPHMHEKQLKPHLQCGTDPRPIRGWSDHDPTTHETVSHPSHRRGRSSRFGDALCMEKHRGFRASAISQKRISCETSFKTPSATPPPAPLAMPFTLREGSYSCKSQWNSIDNSSSSTTCNPIYIAGTILQLQITMEFCRPHMHEKQLKPDLQCGTDPRPIRGWSDHDPTTHETVSHPSHRRGRSSRFGDALCMEKHRVSCICYLSKTHFVRDFLQNSIGNSSCSTTCNPICIAGTILQLQITMPWLTLSLTNSFFD